MSKFSDDIKDFNQMYKLPTNEVPTLYGGSVWASIARLHKFKAILLEEINELDDVIAGMSPLNPLDGLAALADLLGDIQVYCASEMAKFGLPLDQVLAVIMQSNFSKLGADGKPIYDERGKVQKGPNYWKPEPRIRHLLETRMPGASLEEVKPPQAVEVQMVVPEDDATWPEPSASYAGQGGTFGDGASGNYAPRDNADTCSSSNSISSSDSSSSSNSISSSDSSSSSCTFD